VFINSDVHEMRTVLFVSCLWFRKADYYHHSTNGRRYPETSLCQSRTCASGILPHSKSHP